MLEVCFLARAYFTSDLKPLHYKCFLVIDLCFPLLVMFTIRPHFERDNDY